MGDVTRLVSRSDLGEGAPDRVGAPEKSPVNTLPAARREGAAMG
jgi:hypothetical protein